MVCSANDLVGGPYDRVRDAGLENAEFGVDDRGGTLDLGERDDLTAFEPGTRDGKVLDRTLCLCAVEGGARHAHLAHGVVLDAVIGVSAHGCGPSNLTGVFPG